MISKIIFSHQFFLHFLIPFFLVFKIVYFSLILYFLCFLVHKFYNLYYNKIIKKQWKEVKNMPKNKGLGKPTYDHILNLIMSGQLKPGEKIPETKIAEKFKTSRTPVRDAMRQLANDGLLEIYPRRFAQVKEYTPEMITEIGALRISLDTLSIKLALLFGSHIDFLELLDLAKQCEQAHLDGNSMLKRHLDCDFHMRLAEISKNELLIKFQKELYLRVQFILLTYPNPVVNEEAHIKHHYQIAQALIDNDATSAITLITTHLSEFYNLKEKFPESFFQGEF